MIWQNLRKHQPQIDMFRRAVQRGRTAHAYLFVGPDGIGKRFVAQRIIQCLYCQQVPNVELDACGECHACKQVQAGTHPDLLTIACPDGKRELPIDLILGAKERRGREGLCHDLSLRPMSAPHRTAIIDDADRMNEESANALLKTLEEPPPGSILFLITPGIDPILPTIRSRCQPLHFAPLAAADVAALLGDLGWETDPVKAASLAALSDGSLSTARELLEPGLMKLRDVVCTSLATTDVHSREATQQILAAIDDLGSDTAAQRRHAGWAVRFAVEFYRACLQGDESLPPAARLLKQWSPDVPAVSDRFTALLDRCIETESHLAQTMPVPLCLEGLLSDLGRIGSGIA